MEESPLFQWFQWTNIESKFQYVKLKGSMTFNKQHRNQCFEVNAICNGYDLPFVCRKTESYSEHHTHIQIIILSFFLQFLI